MKEKKEPSEFAKKAKAVWKKTKEIWAKIEHVCGIIGKVLYHLRKPALAVPVVWAGMKVFEEARERLPDAVGILLKESGDYMYMLDKEVAIKSCMVLTGACLLLMFLSRKTIYPWLISLFTLVVPILLIVTNMFPA